MQPAPDQPARNRLRPHTSLALGAAGFLAACCLLAQRAHAPAPLHSPWDFAPPQLSSTAYPCPPPSPLPQTLTFHTYYTDAHHSIVDPAAKAAYRRTAHLYESYIQAITHAADLYRATGNAHAAACAMHLLSAAADQRAFTHATLDSTGDRDGFYVQSFYLDGLALAYLKVRPSRALSQSSGNALQRQHALAQDLQIQAWLARIAISVRDFQNQLYTRRAGDSRNNLAYWAGLGVTATGIAAGRTDLFEWGLSRYRIGVRQIASDGSLPIEMARASLALHYHLYSAAPLVLLAELAAANHLDLYSQNNGALHRLVRLSTQGLLDPAFFNHNAGAPQTMPTPLDGSVLGWAVPYQQRFPNPALAALLKKTTGLDDWQIGGNPAGIASLNPSATPTR